MPTTTTTLQQLLAPEVVQYMMDRCRSRLKVDGIRELVYQWWGFTPPQFVADTPIVVEVTQ